MLQGDKEIAMGERLQGERNHKRREILQRVRECRGDRLQGERNCRGREVSWGERLGVEVKGKVIVGIEIGR
jgi:hypothetical protein